jgi:hypothetical protein
MLYTYTLSHDGSVESYDESMAVACLQGIINRSGTELYVLSNKDTRPQYWLDVFSAEGQWLHGRGHKVLADIDSIVELAGNRLQGLVIWDPDLPATINVATTVAGVRDAVVLSPEYAEKYSVSWSLPVIEDLRGRFDGSETGSRKNDAYRWAIREFLSKGLCSTHLLCLFEDAFFSRARGRTSYILTRDWTVMNRSFTFDLSPWGDEAPEDDPDQPIGTDFETYTMILEETLKQSRGEQMTEVAGFFAGAKYTNSRGRQSVHAPVPTEWETVRIISPYNCYQNTIARDCYNQSLHSQAPFKPLKQQRPKSKPILENKAYVCFLMADYDSTTPLYTYFPDNWSDPNRGKIPLSWGVDPNLIETFPDIISYFYSTASENDYFVSDASAAGYMNPNMIRKEYLPLFIRHNKYFFELTDMTIAPMVLDFDEPTPEVKDAFTEFAPDGMAVLVHDFHEKIGRSPKPHLWKGMPVTELLDGTHKFKSPDRTAEVIYRYIRRRPANAPGFYYFRRIWTTPTYMIETMESLRTQYPELDVEVVDPYTFFRLFKEHQERLQD